MYIYIYNYINVLYEENFNPDLDFSPCLYIALKLWQLQPGGDANQHKITQIQFQRACYRPNQRFREQDFAHHPCWRNLKGIRRWSMILGTQMQIGQWTHGRIDLLLFLCILPRVVSSQTASIVTPSLLQNTCMFIDQRICRFKRQFQSLYWDLQFASRLWITRTTGTFTQYVSRYLFWYLFCPSFFLLSFVSLPCPWSTMHKVKFRSDFACVILSCSKACDLDNRLWCLWKNNKNNCLYDGHS